MKLFGKQPIPVRLIAICLFFIVGALIMAFAGFLIHDWMFYKADLKHEYTEQAKFLGQVCTEAIEEDNVILAQKFLSALESNPGIIAVCIYDPQGGAFASYCRRDKYNFSFPSVQLEGVWLNGNQIQVFRRISKNGEFIGTIYLEAEVEPFGKRLWSYVGVVLIVFLISCIVAVVFANLIYAVLSRPVRRLSEIAQRVAREKDFSTKVPKESSDEIGSLIDSFNWMLEQIKQREEELEYAQKDLEKKINERTEELVKINEKLKFEILERQKAEESLRNSQQKLLLHIQQTPLGVIDWTLDQRAINWNPAAEKIFGFKESEVIGKTAMELIIPESFRDEFSNIWGKILNRAGGSHVVVKNKTKSGKIITCEWFNTLLTNREGKAIGVVSLILDITGEIEAQMELRKYEEHTRKTEKMHAIGQLAAGIAHDFNNMLTVIQGHIGMLLTKPGIDSAFRDTLKTVYDASAHAANIVKQLLTFSRKTEFKPSVRDFNEVVKGFYNLISHALGEDIRTKLELCEKVLPVNCDATLVEQLILNLCMNAKDAMPDGGDLLVRTEIVEIKEPMSQKNPERRAGNFVRLIVSDTGIGMDEETKKRIFEPFFTSKSPGKGTGLGLAMVYGIVKQHNGWIEVESEPGKGTTFKIYFPLDERQVVATHEDRTIKPPGDELFGKENVLVVEDEPTLREMVCGLLKQYGYNVFSASNAMEAMNLCEDPNVHFDLLFSDMLLAEGMSGRELARKLKSKFPELKVIITSGYSVDPNINRAEFRDGFIFLPKPFHLWTLLKTVRSILDEKESENGGNRPASNLYPDCINN
jgi:PAS domain S-box-containing protein